MNKEKDHLKSRSKLNCMRHPDRPAAIICNNSRAFCQDCVDTTELRSGYCGYCPYKAGCPIQSLYVCDTGSWSANHNKG